MKAILGFASLSFFAVASVFAADCPNFAGKYTKKVCTVFELGDVTPPDLAIEIEGSNTFVVTQAGCDSVKVDGDTTYWEAAPKIFFSSLDEGQDEIIKLKSLEFGTDSADVTYLVKDGAGLNKNVDRNTISVTKNGSQSIRIQAKVQYRNLLTLGLWKTAADLDCTLSR